MHIFDFGPMISLKSSDKRMWYMDCLRYRGRDLQDSEDIYIAHAVIFFGLGQKVFKWIGDISHDIVSWREHVGLRA